MKQQKKIIRRELNRKGMKWYNEGYQKAVDIIE